MPVMEKLRMFVAQEPVVAASCLIGGVGNMNPNPNLLFDSLPPRSKYQFAFRAYLVSR